MKILLPLTLVLLCCACDSSSNTAAVKTADTPSEELLGKTVSEYEQIKKQQAKSTETVANETAATETAKSDKSTPTYEEEVEKGFLPLKWEGLIAPGFDADSILKKYEPIVSTLEEGSDEAIKLYEKMQAEYNKAPVNETLANKKVSIPGFIAPLEQSNGVITEFLLVPYFGACIHQPAPPSNQTVHVKTAEKFGIKAENAYEPIWVSGELQIEKSVTNIGSASYKVNNAMISEYDMNTSY